MLEFCNLLKSNQETISGIIIIFNLNTFPAQKISHVLHFDLLGLKNLLKCLCFMLTLKLNLKNIKCIEIEKTICAGQNLTFKLCEVVHFVAYNANVIKTEF